MLRRRVQCSSDVVGRKVVEVFHEECFRIECIYGGLDIGSRVDFKGLVGRELYIQSRISILSVRVFQLINFPISAKP